MADKKNPDLGVTKVVSTEAQSAWDQVEDWGGSDATTIHQNTFKEINALAAMSGERCATLVALSGIHLGKTIDLGDHTLNVGRGSNCDIRIDDDSISRMHAEIVPMPNNTYLLRDLGSTNGTFVGRDRIRERVLSEGDRVVFGLRSVYKVVYQDTLEQSYQHALYSSSVRDPLTRIFNRKYIDDKLHTDLSYARRHQTPLSFLLMDVDHFKKVNDNYSHQTGDSVLKGVTRAVQNLVRTEDSLGRYGGEEFAVIVPGTDFDGATLMAERIRELVESLIFCNVDDESQEFSVTISIGVVTVPPGKGVSVDELYSSVDLNLYKAKNEGRNRVVASIYQS